MSCNTKSIVWIYTKLTHCLHLSVAYWKNEPIGDGEEGEDLVGHREERACCALHGDGSRTTIGEEDVGVRGGDKRRRPQGAVGFGDTLVERGIRGSARARETSRLGPTSSGGRH